MKLILIGHPDETVLSTLDLILKNWGYRVMAASGTARIKAFLTNSKPDLLVLGTQSLADLDSAALDLVQKRRHESEAGLFTLASAQEAAEAKTVSADLHLALPLDIFALFAAVQGHLEKHPRRFLRVDVKLPGMVNPQGKGPSMGEVMSLSPQGLFIKVGCRLEQGQKLRTVIPLLGLRREIDVEGTVLYTVQPGPENNYLQGAGIGFAGLSDEDTAFLEGYLEGRFITGIQSTTDSGLLLQNGQVQFNNRKVTVELLRSGGQTAQGL